MTIVVIEGDIAVGRHIDARRTRLRKNHFNAGCSGLVLDDNNDSSDRSSRSVKKCASGCASGELLMKESTNKGRGEVEVRH
jgi:hypothetical protein